MLVGHQLRRRPPARSNVIKASDFLLLHGNGADDPARIRRMIETTRQADGYRPMPVLVNEDDHFRFKDPDNHYDGRARPIRLLGILRPGAKAITATATSARP